MKTLAFLIIAYTAVMLLIHVSTAKLLEKWSGPPGSWIKERFSPQRALRVEALYWLLCLACWTLWPSPAWKALVVAFAVIHLGTWGASEMRVIHLNVGHNLPTQARKAHRFIISFDLVEAGVLVAIGWLAVLYILHAGQHLPTLHAA